MDDTNNHTGVSQAQVSQRQDDAHRAARKVHSAADSAAAGEHLAEKLANLAGKIRKCQALADDARGDPTTRETARRQADALMRQRDEHLARFEPAYWATRPASEAQAAGIKYRVLCLDGWFVPIDQP